MNRNLLYWIWLAEAAGPESDLPMRLYNETHNVETIYKMGKDAYLKCGFLKDSQIAALCDKDLFHAEHIYKACSSAEIGILTLDSFLYPERLRRIQCPPAVLYYRGNMPNFHQNLSIAVVGTRSMTDMGRIAGYRIAYELAVAGAVVVSGMALGIDGIAQIAALDAGGVSVAVLGSAIDRCYPAEHKPLYDRLMKKGLILSEYPPNADTRPWHFPQRNRIISGLCHGTVVVEGGIKSGALITAQCAFSQGRDLFAVPGNANDPASMGTNNLLKAGAFPVTTATDVLVHYEKIYKLDTENLTNPAYFRNYDDTLKYGAERIAQRVEEQNSRNNASSSVPPPQPAANTEPPPSFHLTLQGAPLDMTAREEPLPIPAPDDSQVQYPSDAFPVAASQTDGIGQTVHPETESERFMTKEELIQTYRITTAENLMGKSEPPPKNAEPLTTATPVIPASTREKEVLLMIEENKTFDEMCQSGIPVPELLSTLTMLELSSRITPLPGGLYTLKQ